MAAGLKIQVESCAFGFLASLVERKDFSVLLAFVVVRALADHLAVSIDDESADAWVRGCEP